MSLNWIHKNLKPNGLPAQMRLAKGIRVSFCAGFVGQNYQPTLGGSDRTERKI